MSKTNSATLVNKKYKGKFFSPNLFNLPRCSLTSNEISLLSKRLKFVSISTCINNAIINKELEAYGRNLRLMLHFRNDGREFSSDPFEKNLSLIQKERMQ